MSMQGWVEAIVCAGEDGSALTNTTTATSIIPASRKITLPAGFIDRVGKAFRITAAGRISTVVTTPGTLTLDIRFGSVVVFNGGAMNLNTTAQTNATWQLEAILAARSLGSGTSATMLGIARWHSRALIGSAAVASGYAGAALLPDTAPAAGTGFDSTAAQAIDLFATWSIASASNSIQLHQLVVEALN